MLQIYFKHDSMPRSARLDQPGLLQHVIVRGIEKRDIFLDDEDRDDFVRRLSTLLLETETECLAWRNRKRGTGCFLVLFGSFGLVGLVQKRAGDP